MFDELCMVLQKCHQVDIPTCMSMVEMSNIIEKLLHFVAMHFSPDIKWHLLVEKEDPDFIARRHFYNLYDFVSHPCNHWDVIEFHVLQPCNQ